MLDGETVCLIDFDDMGPGWYLYEMASLLFFFAGYPGYASGLEALVRGYRQEHTLSDITADNAWVFPRYLRIVGDYKKSLEEFSNPLGVSLTEPGV